MTKQPAQFTLEQQFTLRSLNTKVQTLNEPDTKAHLKEVYRKMIVQDIFCKAEIKKQWGI